MPYHLAMSPKSQWCPKPDLNRYGKKYRGILSPLRLPFRHPGKNSLNLKPMERETRFELATPTLARLCSTPELFPHRLRSRNFSKNVFICQENFKIFTISPAFSSPRLSFVTKTALLLMSGVIMPDPNLLLSVTLNLPSQ